MLTKQDIKDYQEALDRFATLESKIIKRIDEVIRIIAEAFAVKHTSFYWCSNREEENVPIDLSGDCVDYIIVADKGKSYPNLSTDYWNYGDSFPVKFFFMKDSEILEELKTEIEKDKVLQEVKKKKQKQSKENKEITKQKALKKLTAAEKKALGINA